MLAIGSVCNGRGLLSLGGRVHETPETIEFNEVAA
jgi:hypothetical protein